MSLDKKFEDLFSFNGNSKKVNKKDSYINGFE